MTYNSDVNNPGDPTSQPSAAPVAGTKRSPRRAFGLIPNWVVIGYVLISVCITAGLIIKDKAEPVAVAPVTDGQPGELIDIESLEIGHCVLDPDDGPQLMYVRVVPCSEPHSQEYLAGYLLTSEEYPGYGEEVDAAAKHRCADLVAAILGPASAGYDQIAIFPGQGSWDLKNERDVMCGIETATVSGSVVNTEA